MLSSSFYCSRNAEADFANLFNTLSSLFPVIIIIIFIKLIIVIKVIIEISVTFFVIVILILFSQISAVGY